MTAPIKVTAVRRATDRVEMDTDIGYPTIGVGIRIPLTDIETDDNGNPLNVTIRISVEALDDIIKYLNEGLK